MYCGMMAAHMGWGIIEEEGWRKGPWTSEEDRLLIEYVRLHGEGRWNSVARLAGINYSISSSLYILMHLQYVYIIIYTNLITAYFLVNYSFRDFSKG